ncbi:PREDICTED: putative zinc finger protein 840 [Habropoda laboriosa]|uniref:putative zinc finger protein 840 n=1 Tax=Habropoda laboriosa TaxID=597456 RepID=UPI00083E0FEE|nr:PREDICTED: putative zinc finger protein 840 [Habropoda laboriosa]
MRVKTVPRQRIVPVNGISETVSEIVTEPGQSSASRRRKEVSDDEEDVSHGSNERTMCNLDVNQLGDRSVKEEKKDGTLNYCEEALDMSIKQKTEAPEKDSSIAGPSRRRCFASHSQKGPKSSICDNDNNNIPRLNSEKKNCCCVTASSSRQDSQSCESEPSVSANNDDRLTVAVNLCIKDFEKKEIPPKKLKDTVLFKIMTDSAFLENIQNHKRPRRYVCQFCKKEFVNNDDLTDHMDVKKEKSHQTEASERNSSVCCSLAGPSNCYLHSEERTKDCVPNDDNNNAVASNGNTESCSVTGSSGGQDCKSNDDRLTEAVNLCKKDRLEEDVSRRSESSCNEKLENTVLFKIMTDPAFLENIQNHKRSRRYMCQFCKQEFLNNDELTDHMDVKKDESNQVVCCACKKTFAQKRYLRYHQRCHSERTKFTCDICTKKYTRMDNLSRHNTFHVNPGKFSCTYCEKTFARKDLLNKHLKCHDSKYRFFCEACQKYFKDPLMLDTHRKSFHSIV